LGTAGEILNRPGKGMSSASEEAAFFTAMETSSRALLQDIPGLGPAGKAKILAAFEIGRRYALFRNRNTHPELRNSTLPQLATRALKLISQRLRDDPQEWFGFVPLLRSGSLGDFCLAERGSRTHVNLDAAELFARILALRPTGLFLFHNHPSGDTLPSMQDYELTDRMDSLTQEFKILLLGHWIVTSQNERWIPTQKSPR
jgi:DNA repair protein RadC